jgi:superfamily I DNA/RNA helicase
MVILTRSAKGWTESFSKVLGDAGIPTYACSQEGYFETPEIQIALNYLQVLDNPRQDIPLTAVLTSMFAQITSEELAIIRSSNQEKTMYDCICHYAKYGQNKVIKERLEQFLSTLNYYRNRVPYMAIHVLLWQILEETGYRDYVSALPGGEQRAANLEMLVEKAVVFEGTSYKGLFNFVRYMEQLKKYAVDYGEANLMDENADVVTEEAEKSNENNTDEKSNKFMDFLKGLGNEVTDLADSAKNALSVFIDAIAVLLITTCVIPILVIFFFLWIIKLIFGLNIDFSTARKWIPMKGIR